MAKMEMGFWDMIKYPLCLWAVIEIITLAFGFTQYVSSTIDIFVGTTALYLAILFGLWVGRRTAMAYKSVIWISLINGFIITIIIGFINLVFLLVLSYYSQNFITAVGAGSESLFSVVINAGVVTWIKMAVLAIVSAGVAHEFSRK